MVYAYLRVSTDKQDGINQRNGIENFARQRGFSIDEYFDDEGVSGTKEPEKRELGILLSKLKDGDVLIAGEISRLGRNLFMVMRILEHCMKNNVKVYTVKDGYELGDNIQSKVLAFAFGLAAEIEREMISRRTKEALQHRKALGVICGRPIGRKTDETKHKLFGKDDEIIDLLNKGVSKRKVAAILGVNRNTLLAYLKTKDKFLGLGRCRSRNNETKQSVGIDEYTLEKFVLKNMTPAEMARELNIATSTVVKYLKKYSLYQNVVLYQTDRRAKANAICKKSKEVAV